MNNEIRWKQRFQNFEKAYKVFQRRLNSYQNNPEDEGNQMSLVQSFEISFELSWKTLKDYLDNTGGNPKNPRMTIIEAGKKGCIADKKTWLKSLERRNETAHTYDEKILEEILAFIAIEYDPLLKELYLGLKKEL